MLSDFVASLQYHKHRTRMDPTRALDRELSRLDTRRDLEFRSCI